ncbi:uncharacterized protein ACR2FA_008084 [Aphomia sociella]
MAGPQLKAISSMSSGLDHIDLDEVKKRNIPLGNTPAVLNDAVADIAVGLMIAAARRFKEGVRDVESGEWKRGVNWTVGQDIVGSTVGIVGLGGIGQAIVRRLKGFDVARFVYSGRSDKPEAKTLGVERLPQEQLLKESDYVILACPLTAETRNTINCAALRMMKKTSVLVNIGRGELIDQEALFEALRERYIFAAGLDVTTPEPLPSDHPLVTLPNCYIVPHLGSSTINTRNAMAQIAANNVLLALDGHPMQFPGGTSGGTSCSVTGAQGGQGSWKRAERGQRHAGQRGRERAPLHLLDQQEDKLDNEHSSSNLDWEEDEEEPIHQMSLSMNLCSTAHWVNTREARLSCVCAKEPFLYIAARGRCRTRYASGWTPSSMLYVTGGYNGLKRIVGEIWPSEANAPYHPASNGAAESAVKICKRAINKALKQNLNVDTVLCRFLLAYRNTEHATTGDSPANILQGRRLRMRLDNLKPERETRVAAHQEHCEKAAGGMIRHFEPGAQVWYREYRGTDKWMAGTVIKQLGNTDYCVKSVFGTEIHRHIDQLRRRVASNVEPYKVEKHTSLDIATRKAVVSKQSRKSLIFPVTKGEEPEQYVSDTEEKTFMTEGPATVATQAGVDTVPYAACEPNVSENKDLGSGEDVITELRRPMRERKPPVRFGYVFTTVLVIHSSLAHIDNATMTKHLKVLVSSNDIPVSGVKLLQEHFTVVQNRFSYMGEDEKVQSAEECLKLVAGCSAIVWVSNHPITDELLDRAGPNLKIVATASAGYNHCNVEGLKARGIKLTNTPGVLSAAVAEIAVGLMLAAARRYTESLQQVASGKWIIGPDKFLGQDIRGATVGIVGFGGIGQATAKRLVGFEVGRIIYSGHREKPEGKALGATLVSQDDLLSQSDFIILAAPLTNETRHMINKTTLGKMKKNAIVINVGRGDLIDQEALYEALKNRDIYAAGLDVTSPEPLSPDHKLLTLPNVFVLPHIGSGTERTRNDMSILAAQNVINALTRKPLITPVLP